MRIRSYTEKKVDQDVEVAIIGGGLGGLTLAASLLQRSIPVQIFEQVAELREIGAGIALGANATRLLKQLGIDLQTVANVPPDLEFRRWKDASLIWSHPIGQWYEDEMGAPFFTLHRGTLQRLLAEQVPKDDIHLDHRLSAIGHKSDGVRLQFDNGKEVSARIAIGVDGVHSVARQYVAGEVPTVYSGEIGFRGVIPIERSQFLPNPTAVDIWCGPGTHLVYYGLDKGRLINLLAVYKPQHLPDWTEHTSRMPGTSDDAVKTFEKYGWNDRILDLVRNIEGDMNFWALQDLPRLARWSRGRVTLLGDAAHAPLPHQGQGAGQTIEDAYVLGHALAKTGIEKYQLAFNAYENQRKQRTRQVQLYSRMAGRWFKLTGNTALKRDSGMSQLPQEISWIHQYKADHELLNLGEFG